MSKREEFWAGVRATLPLVLGAIPFGIIFGALAVNSGVSPTGGRRLCPRWSLPGRPSSSPPGWWRAGRGWP